MKKTYSYYRALTEFKKVTANRFCEAQKESIKNAVSGEERITVTRNLCVIEEDWVKAIETGLVFVEKVINEERQFIKSNGEVVPIEKAKHVSKDSVEHLARHSDMLTRKPEGDQIIPDKIYNTERLSDFAVYENRFLYMLLCYLRDFIALRYDKILKYTNLYDGELSVKKDVHSGKQRIRFEASLKETRDDDEYLKTHNKAKSLIDRIDTIYKLVLAFLRTPLMEEVSKASKLRPPITKTNVLRMNKNFKGAVALYEFVTAYDKDGFTITPEVRNVNGFFDETGDDFAEALSLYSFLTYEYGLDLKSELKENFIIEERRRKEEEKEKLKQQIENLRRKIKNGGTSMEEYVLLVEKRNRQLEECEEELGVIKRENEVLKNDVTEKSLEIDGLKLTAEQTAKKHEEIVIGLNERREREIEELNAAHDDEKQNLINGYEERITDTQNAHAAQIADMNVKFDEERAQAKATLEESRRETERVTLEKAEEKARLDRLCGEKDDEIKYLKNEKRRADEAAIASAARYTALRKERGLIGEDEDFTTEDSFGELERQYVVLKKFFKEEWRKTKKRIREENIPFFKRKKKADAQAEKAAEITAEAAATESEETKSLPQSEIVKAEDNRGAAQVGIDETKNSENER